MNHTTAKHRRKTIGLLATSCAIVAGAVVTVPAAGIFSSVSAATTSTTTASTTAATTAPTKFQFGPAGSAVAAGYTLDTGAAFNPTRGYGWQALAGSPLDMSWATRVRTDGTTTLQKTVIQAAKGGSGVTWNLALANGTYSITVGVGDASYTDSVDTVSAEGTSLVAGFKPTAASHFATGTANVTVTGGKLTVSTAGGTNVKLDYLTVGPAVAAPPVPATSPTHLAWMYNTPTLTTDLAPVATDFNTFIVSSSQTALISKVRTMNTTANLSQYFLLDQIIKPPTGAAEFHNNAAYDKGDFASLLKNHPDYFMRDSAGNPIVDQGTYYRMDPGNAGWRAFWLSRVEAASTNWSGVFADNTDVSMCGLDKQGRVIPKYTSDATYTDAIAGMLKYAWDNYFSTSGKSLMLNETNNCTGRDMSAKYTPYSTTVFHEGWGVDWHTGYLGVNSWNAQLAGVEAQTARGEGAVLIAQGAKSDTTRQAFAFGSYLLVESPKVSFRYSQYTDNGYDYPWMYANYNAKLGTATGARYLLSDGTWRRDFTNGYVTVNPTTHVSKISVD
jgi:hypothetical protein